MVTEGSRKALWTNLELRRYLLESMKCGLYLVIFLIVSPFRSLPSCDAQSITTDTDGLMAFKAAADVRGVLNPSWIGLTNPCGNATTQPWLGITCNSRGRVSHVTLPSLQLSGTFAANTLSRLNELRFLTLANNSFSGSLPDDLSSITGLVQLWAQSSGFSGSFPGFLNTSKRLVKVDLSGNKFTGPIPDLSSLPEAMLLNLRGNFFQGYIPPLPPALLTLDLSDNSLTGNIPLLPSSLVSLSLENNRLTGEIPPDLIQKFTNVSFAGNPGLCGPPLTTPCLSRKGPGGSASPSPSPKTGKKHSTRLTTPKIIIIVVADIVVLAIIGAGLVYYYSRPCAEDIDVKPTKKASKTSSKWSFQPDNSQVATMSTFSEVESTKLTFFEGSGRQFDLEDLLRASAEMLGKGSFGTAYKAILDGGSVVAVKRMRDVKDIGMKEFDLHMEILGRLRHPNLVPLRAFYYAKEEKLLVFDFMVNGSLFSLLHGSRGARRTPLNWTSRLRIAHDVAVGLNYLHQECGSQKIPHGNIKSSNILLGKDFEVCISDYGLVPLMTPAVAAQRMAGHRAPEYIQTKRISHKADVYSFGVLLLEVLTGRQPAHSSYGEGIDLPRWVHSVVREEWTGEVFDLELRSYRHAEEEMVSLLQIAMGCVAANPEHRPGMAQVVELIEDIRRSGDSYVESGSFDTSVYSYERSRDYESFSR